MSTSRVNRNEEGVRIIAAGKEPITADIILVHGLGGHPRKTWLYKKTAERSNKWSFESIKRMVSSANSDETPAYDGFFWPLDALAKDFPNIRIASYGYDSHVSNFFAGPSDKTTIVGHGRSLLNELESFRRSDPARPIIFVVHSLGGLVLKQAMRQMFNAQTYESDWRDIYEATRAVCFLGTPHDGSQLASWGLLARNIASTVGFDASDSIIRDLKVDASILDSLRDDFSKVLREESFWVFTFMEQKGHKGLRGLNEKIVPDASATLGYAREQKDSINAKHVDMCRFSSEEDNGYRKLRNAIDKALQGPPPPISRARPTTSKRNWNSRHKLLDALKQDGFFALRYAQVEPAFDGSFSWLFEKEDLGFEHWLQGSGGLYWIKGLPATGKSTLMKMAYNDERTKRIIAKCTYKSVQAEFFFSDRGSIGQKSFTGLLHAILYQVLSAFPSLISVVEPAFTSALPIGDTISAPFEMDVLQAGLQCLLNQSVEILEIYLFVDALDEYAGSKADIAEFLIRIATQPTNTTHFTKFKVCFSSRPHNDLLDHFEELKLPGFDIKDHTRSDIKLVVWTMLEQNPRIRSILGSNDEQQKQKVIKVADTVCSRAEGVFLWVRLLLRDVLREYTDRKSLDQLIDLVSDLPADLERYYLERIIDRIPQSYREDTLTIFDIVRCVMRPLKTEEFDEIFHEAHAEGSNIATQYVSKPSAKCLADLDRLLLSCSGGLIETQRVSDSEYHVQFIHLTVKSCVAKVETRQRISPHLARSTTGHEYFVRYCVRYLNRSSGNGLSPDFDEEFLNHVALAEHETKISQLHILQQLNDRNLRSVYGYGSLIWAIEMKRTPLTTLLSFAVAGELELLVKEYLGATTPSQNDLNSALWVAVSLTKAFIVLTSNLSRRYRILQSILDLIVNLKVMEAGLTSFQRLWVYGSSLEKTYLVESPPDPYIVKQFLDHGQTPDVVLKHRERVSIGVWSIRETTPLHRACNDGELQTATYLLDHGAQVDTLDSQFRTPLDLAVQHIGVQMLKVLGLYGSTALEARLEAQDAARELQNKLGCITLLCDRGGELAQDSDIEKVIFGDRHIDRDIPMMDEILNQLENRGFDVERRLLNLPRQGSSYVATVRRTWQIAWRALKPSSQATV